MVESREVIVYSRPGCHLCELMLEALIPLCRGRARIIVRDVDAEASWRAAYGERIPVLCFRDREICAVRLDHAALVSALEEQG